MTVEALRYAIDDQDRLISVDDGFYRFAEENGWPDAGSSLGRSLWEFVAGADVIKLQRLLLRRIREGLHEVRLPFSCDSPELSREMEIRIVADRSGRVLVFDARLRSERRREAAQPLLDAKAPRGEERLPMCAWCDRFEVDGEWLEVEQAAQRLELFRRPRLPALEPGVCPRDRRLLQGHIGS